MQGTTRWRQERISITPDHARGRKASVGGRGAGEAGAFLKAAACSTHRKGPVCLQGC